MKIRNDYKEDIREAFACILITWLVLEVLALIFFSAAFGASRTSRDQCESYNDFATTANESFDVDQRKMLTEWLYSEEDLGEDGLFTIREEPVTFWDIIQENWAICAAIVIGIFSACAFLTYFFNFDSEYYLADLPFKTFYGWFILIVCFVGWPFFIISRIRFQQFKKRRKTEEDEGKAKSDTIRLPEIDPIFDEEAFLAFCYEILPFGQRIKRAEKDLAEDEARVNGLGETLRATAEELKEAQLQMGQDLAKLNDLRSENNTTALSQKTRAQILHDFAEIKAMHGVKQIFVDDDGNLVIIARADYDLHGTLYDIGDFMLTLYDDELVVTLYSDRNPRIHYCLEQFCFGDRAEDIDAYVKAGRIVEAVELAITCINHINADHVDSIPQLYKKIVD